MDQGGQERGEVDEALLPNAQRQPSPIAVIRVGLQSRQLPAATGAPENRLLLENVAVGSFSRLTARLVRDARRKNVKKSSRARHAEDGRIVILARTASLDWFQAQPKWEMSVDSCLVAATQDLRHAASSTHLPVICVALRFPRDVSTAAARDGRWRPGAIPVGRLGAAKPGSVERPGFGRAKSCIVLFCWGGMSHLNIWDPKPESPAGMRGPFQPISTATPGIQFGEHVPLLAKQTERLAIIRSLHHRSAAHGRGMYWSLTGQAPPRPESAENLPPSRHDWPSLTVMVGHFRQAPKGIPRSIRLPCPMVNSHTLQAGGIDRARIGERMRLLALERPFERTPAIKSFEFHRELAADLLLNPTVHGAFDLDREPRQTRDSYGDHICGTSMLLSRQLIEAGVPIVTVVCAANDLTIPGYDHWDTHGDNFNRLKNIMLPTFDRAAGALLDDLADRGLRGVSHRIRPHAEDQRQRRTRPLPRLLLGNAGRWWHPWRSGVWQLRSQRGHAARLAVRAGRPVRHHFSLARHPT
jgi:hypothetical protein